MSTSLARCPQCAAPLPADAPEGLCPNCLMALNLGPETAFTGDAAAPAPAPLSPSEIAPHFPQLEIVELLGRGGMGVVYKARQKSLGRTVALKLLAPEREKDPQFAERFTREAQALARLDHPHIVTIHDFGQTNGFFYLLMEFVDGVNLRELLRTRKLTPEEALAIVPPLCEALQFAHERGIVHRDIKPENLLLARDGAVKIADFGIAKMLGETAPAAEEKAAGTPGYMAPEQTAAPERVDSRSDIYSLGVVFYEMLTGELPARRLELPSSRLRGVQIDVRIDDIVLRALQKEPELRYQTADQVRAAVTAVSSSGGAARQTTSASPPPAAPAPTPAARSFSSRFAKFAAILIAALVLIPLTLIGIYLMFARQPAQPPIAQEQPAEPLPPAIAGSALQLRVSPQPGKPEPPPPSGAAFSSERQYIFTANSRVAFELHHHVNDGERARIVEPLNFKTPVGSGLGVVVRWHGYGENHPTHANRWIIDLIDPNRNVTFYRVEGRFPQATRMLPLDGRPPGDSEPNSLMQPGSQTFIRLIRSEEIVPEGEAIRHWSEVQAFLSWLAPNQAGDPAQFQLPAVDARAPAPSAGHGPEHLEHR